MTFPRAFQSYVPKSHCVSTQVYGAVVLSPDNCILVIQGRQSEKWSFPKGHGLSSETPLEAALRELKEETGIDLQGRKPDNERRFRSNLTGSGGTYFIFQLEDKPEICPEDTKEVMNSMWCPSNRLPYLLGNMDLTTFCRRKYHLDTHLADPNYTYKLDR